MREILCWEFHVSRLCFAHHDWRAFSFTPWLPYKSTFQAVYVAYRWITLLFFFAYLFRAGIGSGSVYYLQYLTNWGHIVLVAHLIWAAVSVTFTFIRILVLKKSPHKPIYDKNWYDKPPGCCGCEIDSTSWYHKVYWVLFTASSELAMAISLLYWGLAHDSSTPVSDIDIVLHVMNAVLSYFDLWVVGTPVRLYHVYITFITFSVYSVFTGIHYAALVKPNITGPIYDALDYEARPGPSTASSLISVFVGSPAIHMIYYISYLLREALLSCVKKKIHHSDNNEVELEVV